MRFHRFIALEPEDFIHPADRSRPYTVIEMSMFEGRSPDAKRELIRKLFARIEQRCGIAPQDVEMNLGRPQVA